MHGGSLHKNPSSSTCSGCNTWVRVWKSLRDTLKFISHSSPIGNSFFYVTSNHIPTLRAIQFILNALSSQDLAQVPALGVTPRGLSSPNTFSNY